MVNQSIINQSSINPMNLQLTTDLIIHLQDTGYEDLETNGMTPAINFLKGRGVELTEPVINHAKRLISINF